MALIVPLSMSITKPADPENPDREDLPPVVETVEYPAAYARILTVRVMKDLTFITVIWHANEAARMLNEEPVLMQEFFLETAALAGTVYPSAYSYLKTLPRFAGASDHPVADVGDIVTPAWGGSDAPASA